MFPEDNLQFEVFLYPFTLDLLPIIFWRDALRRVRAPMKGQTEDTFEERLRHSRESSWDRRGKKITFFLPGMFTLNGLSGRYPAISLTGSACALQCEHCKGKTLETMIPATTPEGLLDRCLRLAEKGSYGILLSGGCDNEGRLPWRKFLEAIREVKERTGLYISIHCGLVDAETALALREAGVDQALIDVIGDDETYRKVYHVDFGISHILSSLEALQEARLPVVPHIVCGLNQGRPGGEAKALEMVSRFPIERLVIVALMRVPGTPSREWRAISPGEVAELIVQAGLRLPHADICLGCARERGDTRMETWAVDAGVTRMALPSSEAIRRAQGYGMEIRYQRSCCSVSSDWTRATW